MKVFVQLNMMLYLFNLYGLFYKLNIFYDDYDINCLDNYRKE